MPPVLFFPLRLPQLKLPRLLTLPLGTGLHPARSLALLALEPERLLCLGADAGGCECAADLPLHALGIAVSLGRRLRRQRRAEARRCQLTSTKA